MARTYLKASPARRLIVEVDWVSGRAPSQEALDHLSDILERYLDKREGVAVERGNEISAARGSYSVGDLAALERAHRARHSSGEVATAWIAYVDGRFENLPGALGVAFRASSAAIFRDRIDDAATALILATEIERSVLVHEFGHLLALVNIGYRSAFAHEDPEHPTHSSNRGSVMYWAVEDVSLRTLLAGGPPSDFDDADRADLEMLRST